MLKWTAFRGDLIRPEFRTRRLNGRGEDRSDFSRFRNQCSVAGNACVSPAMLEPVDTFISLFEAIPSLA